MNDVIDKIVSVKVINQYQIFFKEINGNKESISLLETLNKNKKV